MIIFTPNTVIKSADVNLNFANLASTVFSGQINTYTPTIGTTSTCTASPLTSYYANLGGLKVVWGKIIVTASGTGCRVGTVSYPTFFFTTFLTNHLTIEAVGSYPYQIVTGDGASASSFNMYISNTGAAGVAYVTFIAIGL